MHTLLIERTRSGRFRFKCECGVRYRYRSGSVTPDQIIEEHREHVRDFSVGGHWTKLPFNFNLQAFERTEQILWDLHEMTARFKSAHALNTDLSA